MRAQDPWFYGQGVSVMDMALFGLALICHRIRLPWRSFKYITDDTDEQAGDGLAAQKRGG
jgi:adenosylhomocysteine nucleosidase